jgi:hypothetical protein
MTLSDPEKLARYVQSLTGFEFYKTIDGNYDYIGATVADAVLQANNKYSTHGKHGVRSRIVALHYLFSLRRFRTRSQKDQHRYFFNPCSLISNPVLFPALPDCKSNPPNK